MLNIQHFLNVCQKVGRRGGKNNMCPSPPIPTIIQYINGGRTILFFFMCDYFVSRIIKNKHQHIKHMYIFHRKVQMPFLLKYHIVLLYVCVFSHNSVSCPRKTVYCTIHGSAKTIRLPSEIEQQNHINSLYLFI